MKRILMVSCYMILSVSVAMFSLQCAGKAVKQAEPVSTDEVPRDTALKEDDSDTTYSKGLKLEKEESFATKESAKTKALAPKKMDGSKTASGLKAGFADDNKQFNYFVNFIKDYKDKVQHYPINISERIIFYCKDIAGKSIPNAKVNVFSGKKLLETGKTYADGSFMFYPSEYDAKYTTYVLTFEALNTKAQITVDRQGKREHTVTLNTQRPQYKNVPLDILFVFDTTGSMNEEIARLKKTIEIINLNIASLSTKPDVRFGMVLYKDKGDEYVTKIIPLTGNLEKFQKELSLVTAGGGGDGPEDLQSALADAVKKIQWNTGGIRLAFIITDAEAHLDYGQQYTYVDAAHDAKKEAIKFYSLGTGGLPLMGEFILRQISQYTQGRYIFLTYGERGESEGGKEGSVSHHTGANFQTDKLESIIIRFAKEELAYLTDQPLEEDEAYFDAKKVEDETNEQTLQKLFDMAIAQLIDYSAINIQKGEPTAVLPIKSSDAALSTNAEYFTEQLSMALGKNKVFTQVERKNMQQILHEIGLGQTGIVDEASAAKAGKMLGAKMLITGTLYPKNANYEIFLKLIRVESAEVLSATKAIVDKNLGVAEGVKKPQPKQPVKKKQAK
ncbi:MAG: CsgG/HfaB family protein [Spirochaetota bacterium]|nr:CsgG/HfaB family protein [Spirochaetota bacterium]